MLINAHSKCTLLRLARNVMQVQHHRRRGCTDSGLLMASGWKCKNGSPVRGFLISALNLLRLSGCRKIASRRCTAAFRGHAFSERSWSLRNWQHLVGRQQPQREKLFFGFGDWVQNPSNGFSYQATGWLTLQWTFWMECASGMDGFCFFVGFNKSYNPWHDDARLDFICEWTNRWPLVGGIWYYHGLQDPWEGKTLKYYCRRLLSRFEWSHFHRNKFKQVHK